VLEHLAEAGHDGVRLLGAGHRVVHGGERFSASIRVDDAVISAVRSFSHLAPPHNPANLAGIEAVRVVLPELPQVAVFDTAVSQTMPPHALSLIGYRPNPITAPAPTRGSATQACIGTALDLPGRRAGPAFGENQEQ
jgi:hypothetical protein